MKNILILAVVLTFFSLHLPAQLISIVGYNGSTPDGISFVALEDIPSGTVIYFTENEHLGGGIFNSGESVLRWTSPSGVIAKGDVVILQETGTNVMTATCTSGTCGTVFTIQIPISFASSSVETVYAYSDTDNDHTNGVTEIYCAFVNFGPLPNGEDPTSFSPNALVIDGFTSVTHKDYTVALRSNSTSKIALENPSNYTQLSGNNALSTTAFNINLSGSNPPLTVTVSPTSVLEDGATNLVYTFTLASDATSNITVNFTTTGTASGGDYTTSGPVIIPNGNNSATLTVNPTTDSGLEPAETVIVTIDPGIDYDVGNPSQATGTILNDDSQTSCPLVAVVGLNHTSDGFSFVALDDLAMGFEAYFTEEEFNNSTLAFGTITNEAILKWTAPMGVNRGDVFVVTETATSDVFNVTCTDGSGSTCGSIDLLAGSFAIATEGEGFYSYADTDDDPTNGISEIYSVLYTGVSSQAGGNIPSIKDPSSVYSSAIVIDGFPTTPMPSRVEYDDSKRNMTVDDADFLNLGNWIHAGTNQTLSTVPFSNIIVKTGVDNPEINLTVNPGAIDEDGMVNMVFTFTLDQMAAGDILINFDVGGSAVFSSDYSASGNPVADFTFGASAGTVTIADGTNSASVTLDPSADLDLEPDETVMLTLASGTGYDPGASNMASGTISNDDTDESCPPVAISGINHLVPDGFSFVALQDITSGTDVYFTEEEFDKTSLQFGPSSGEAVFKWTAPSGVTSGDVFVVKEGASNTFSISCTDGSGSSCGTIVLLSGGFAIATDGEGLYAYGDTDSDPTNGISAIYSILYTGVSSSPGGTVPVLEDPTQIFVNAWKVDGFPATSPNRTEYDPSLRMTQIDKITFENTNNWVHNQTNQDLSVVAFTDITLGTPPMITVDPMNVTACIGASTIFSVTATGSNLTYQWQADGMDISDAGPYSGANTANLMISDVTGLNGKAYQVVVTSGCNVVTSGVGTLTVEDILVNYTTPIDLCIDAGEQTNLGSGTPIGGVYSGPGVTDDGNGMTYSFDPAVVGVGSHTITYSVTTGTPCVFTASDMIEVFPLSTVTFTALPDLCLNDGVQTGLGGGTPTGGVYSGNGVTDDGNGMTYSFDPAAASVGTHTLRYTFTDGNGCSNSSTDDVEVLALPNVMFAAPADLCIDAGVQTGLGAGTPAGGVYVGAGVTDDGNGMTYTFDPAAAGVGIHALTYTVGAAGCTGMAMDDVQVFALPVVMFTALADLCIDAGVQTGLGAGTPSGGVYSGPGVTDDGNGMTYSFDPAAAGVGSHSLTYSFTDANGCSNSASNNVEVFDLPVVIFTALADLCVDAGVQTALGGGTPMGGVYSGPGVTDDGNGMTYDFDPAAAGVGTHAITYTYTDDKGCSAAASDMVEVFPLPVVMFTAPADLCIDAGVQAGLGGGTPPQGTATGDLGVYSGPGVTDDGNGMTYSFDPATAGVGTHTITYTYTDENVCLAAASDMIQVFALPVVMFTAPADLCIDAGVQAGQGGGTPPKGSATGDLGVYSGPGVTDDGNGMTYSFDPAVAGVGIHTINYTYTDDKSCSATASDMIQVFALPVVMFSAPADLCIDAGVQAGQGGGTPPQGSATGDMAVYAGPGVTDDGNGMTYSFDPASAGVGTHTITYTYTDDKDCSAAASDIIQVFALPAVMFTAPADLCIDAGVQAGLGGGTPPQGTATGDLGVYSGPGVTDDGNGMTYSFDPTAAGVGTHSIMYTYTDEKGCSATASDMVEVFALPVVMFTAPADLCVDAGVQAGLGGGTPPQGTVVGDMAFYSGPGVTDDGNGMTYSFDPAAAGVGTHTIIYIYTDEKGCIATGSDMVEVFALPVVMFTAPADLCVDAGVQAGLGGGTPPQGTVAGDMASYSGPGVTDDGNGMTYSFDPATAGVGTHTLRYTYTDGNGCTVFAEDDIAVGTVPGGPMIIQGPEVICPSLKKLMYSIGDVNTAISYTWSFSDASATIANNGSNMVTITFDETFSGGTLSVTADNTCGPSVMQTLAISLGTTQQCDLYGCLSEAEGLILGNDVINALNALDVYQNYNRIESDATISDPRTITFKAGNEIELKPPFEVEQGATFIAEIESCLEEARRK